MSTEVYDEIEIEDLDFDAESEVFYYPCPCGDKFQITLEDIKKGECIAKCPSCSLTIRIIYDDRSYEEYRNIAQEMKAWFFILISLNSQSSFFYNQFKAHQNLGSIKLHESFLYNLPHLLLHALQA